LPAKPAGYYLSITNFNPGSATPVLYDVANGEQYVAVPGPGNTFLFALTGSSNTRKLVLVSEDPSNISTVNGLTQKNFINFSNSSNQGNYIIISNPSLYTGSSGNNPVIDYKNYRSSLAGGSYNAQVIDINELVDQFAFGIKKHPLSIKNFLNYARANYAAKPQFVFLIGRGMAYNDYRTNESDPSDDILNPVPTFGYPASDPMLSSADATHAVAQTPIGRLAAIYGTEVEIYLKKMQEYEQAQQSSSNNVAGRDWMKNIVHVTGATDPFTEATLCGYMNSFKQIIIDTLFGANVNTFCSTDVNSDNQVSSTLFPPLFSSGISMLTYFGHSNASSLGFNLDDPSIYNNTNKYPVFYINGCYAGNFFTFDPGRLGAPNSLSESYVLAKEKGTIAFVASSHYGIIVYLGVLLNGLYKRISVTDYGKQLGTIQADAAQDLINVLPTDYFARCHAEEMNIDGDPALKINTEPLPDYDIEPQMVKISPAFISVSNNTFIVNANFENLGKAVSDSITILVTRKYPDGSSTTLMQKKIPGVYYTDSIQLLVPIIPTRDKGQNYITVTINAGDVVPEITYANNSVTTSVFIYQDELTPIYPYNYAIVNSPTQKLWASTANPLAASTQYEMQIDTTALFNSPVLVSKFITSIGGALQFDPGLNYRDSTVYYWRTSIVPAQNGQFHWNEFSFIYIDSLASSAGFNQSHFFQQTASTPSSTIALDSVSRLWKFNTIENSLYVRNTIYPTGSPNQPSFTITYNGITSIGPGCNYNELIFNVFDAVTFKPWLNNFTGPTGLYNSELATCGTQRQYNFDYFYTDPVNRKKAMDFMDSIPNGDYVVVRSNVAPTQAGNTYANQWWADTSIYGPGNSLYNKLVAAGFLNLDSFVTPRCLAFVYKKNDLSFTPIYELSQGIYDQIFISTNCPSPATSGTVTSPKFGPAKQWKQLHWRGASLENPSTDSVGIQVIGIDTVGNQTPLYNLGFANPDFDISAINAKQYPYLQLQMTATDTVHGTPYQLRYWRLNYLPVPEGALAPNIYSSFLDTLGLGQSYQFGIAFKNVSVSNFDSLLVSLSLTDKNNVTHSIPIPRKKALISGDTLKFTNLFNTASFPGMNTIYLFVNPNNDQPEQYLFNNFMYQNFYVKTDQTNPLLDVTFDNVHILNEDIVSARPHIQIKLTDESKYLLLNDTSLVSVQLRYPDGSLHPYYFSTDTLRFTPAASTTNNSATVDFYPVFTKQYNPEGDEYVLFVTGKDKSGNPAGTVQYQVSFKIITKAMISNMLNYPNPFTTSTAFVFTITGSEVPQNIKIQILTITGKVVREITKDELGPLHVGTNITEFKWDGTDMFHQRLANGVYLYHVVTNLNGKSLDKYTASGDNTDQFFIKGYGKMYLMR
jgi:Peptidase family C25